MREAFRVLWLFCILIWVVIIQKWCSLCKNWSCTLKIPSPQQLQLPFTIYLLVSSRDTPPPTLLHFWIVHQGIYLIETMVFMGRERIMRVSSLMSIFSENVAFYSRCLSHLRTSLDQLLLLLWGFSLLLWARLTSLGICLFIHMGFCMSQFALH